MPKQANRYSQIITHIFTHRYQPGQTEVDFTREDFTEAANELQIGEIKNLGDLVYFFRYRSELPDEINQTAPERLKWIIRPIGTSRYRLVLAPPVDQPNPSYAETKIPDSTPGVITRYALGDEQSLLAKIRYNRLIDIFTGLTCYSLQNHLRTTVRKIGQVETDEIYIGLDKRGAHYVLPVQAKSPRDRIGIVQIEQDMAMTKSKFPNLISRPIAAQFMDQSLIALLEFEQADDGVRIAQEKHYRLVTPDNLSQQELVQYHLRPLE